MPDIRDVELGGVWANGAVDPPVSPVTDTTYKDSGLLQAEIEAAWPYSAIVESAKFNEFMYRVSRLLNILEQNGVMTWNPATAYETGAWVLYSDGVLYRALRATVGDAPPVSNLDWAPMDVAAHAALTAAHGATAAATANLLVLRDANGRAQVAAPAAAADIARKDNVDTVQTNLNTHSNLTGTSTPHGATAVATANTVMKRDAAGRSQVAAPVAAADIARYDTVSAHSNLTGTSTPHGATASGNVNTVMKRDANGRAQVAAPNTAADIARLDTVTNAVGVHDAAHQAAHGVYHGLVGRGGGAILPSGWSISRESVGVYVVTHNLATTGYAPVVSTYLAETEHIVISRVRYRESNFMEVRTTLADGTPHDANFHFIICVN